MEKYIGNKMLEVGQTPPTVSTKGEGLGETLPTLPNVEQRMSTSKPKNLTAKDLNTMLGMKGNLSEG